MATTSSREPTLQLPASHARMTPDQPATQRKPPRFEGKLKRAMKSMVIGAAACGLIVAAVGITPSAAGSPANPMCEKVRTGMVCEADPPGMNFDAVLGQPCRGIYPVFIFGRGPSGELVCEGAPVGRYGQGIWASRTQVLFGGSQQPGFGCPSWVPGGAAAQTGDGRALLCEGDTWVVYS